MIWFVLVVELFGNVMCVVYEELLPLFRITLLTALFIFCFIYSQDFIFLSKFSEVCKIPWCQFLFFYLC